MWDAQLKALKPDSFPWANRFANLTVVSTENKETQAPEAPGACAEDLAPATDWTVQLDAITSERDQLAIEKAELTDLLLRRQAEFDNFRRRTERERSEFVQYAGSEVVREILPILDDFERALKAECADPGFAKGVELIYQRLLEALKKQGLEAVEAVGQTFDPYLHQAVDREETDEVEDQTVLAEYQTGYNFKSKLLRPSMVRVAVKPS